MLCIFKKEHLTEFWPVEFHILAFSINFWPIKIALPGNTVWLQFSGFQKLDHF